MFPEAVEVGPENNKTVQQIATLIKELTNSNSKIINLPMRPGEIPGATVSADVSTLRHVDMSDATLMPIEKGMALTIEYYKSII